MGYYSKVKELSGKGYAKYDPTHVIFIKNHCLMDESVESRPAVPVIIKFGDSEILTKIPAQGSVTDINGNKFDVLFIGTIRGKVIKTAVRRGDMAGRGGVGVCHSCGNVLRADRRGRGVCDCRPLYPL